MSPSLWRPRLDLPQEALEVYEQVSKLFQRKAANGLLDPLVGNLTTAYQFYELPPGRVATDQTLTRKQTMPTYTNYTVNFKGTLDHILVNERFTVLKLLEVPDLS